MSPQKKSLMKKSFPSWVILTSAIALTACGGGSNDTVANQDPQGFWLGSSDTGYNIAAVVLENGQYYALFSKGGVVDGANYGNIKASGLNFSGSLENIDYPSRQTNSGTISGTFSPKSKLQGITAYSNNTVGAFTAAYDTAYDVPATLSAIAGRYAGPTNKLGATGVLNIDQNGEVNGTTTAPGATIPRCIITGTVVPRPSGKNVYDLSLAWDNNPNSTDRCCYGSACGSGEPSSGIATLGVNNPTTLYTAWINPAKTSGFFWVGQKQ